MIITEIKSDKKRYLDLLLLGDEQESMIDRYLDRSVMYVLLDPDVRAVCAVTDEGGGILEIKNIAVRPEYQHKGYGKALIQYIEDLYRGRFNSIKVGTGDSPLTVPFYEKCGFTEVYRVKDFFSDNYDHPIYECGKQLVDMIYFEKRINNAAKRN